MCLIVVGLALVSPRAHAGTRGEWVLGLAPTYAFIVLDNKAEPRGGGASLFLTYGLSDAIALRLSGLWTGHNIEADEETEGGLYQVANVAFGLQYAIDLLSVTPSIEAGAGLLYLRYGDGSAVNLGLHFGLAVDYWLARWICVGAAFHYHAFISNPADYPVYFDAGPRVAIRWQ